LIIPRIRLGKRKSTEEQIINEIHFLLHGTGVRPYPLTVTETAKVLGVSRDTIYKNVKNIKDAIAFSNQKYFKISYYKLPSL